MACGRPPEVEGEVRSWALRASLPCDGGAPVCRDHSRCVQQPGNGSKWGLPARGVRCLATRGHEIPASGVLSYPVTPRRSISATIPRLPVCLSPCADPRSRGCPGKVRAHAREVLAILHYVLAKTGQQQSPGGLASRFSTPRTSRSQAPPPASHGESTP